MRTIFHNIGSLQTMDDNSPITFGKSIVVNNNRIESLVESTEEFESSDANSLMLVVKQLFLVLSIPTITWYGRVIDLTNTTCG